MLERASAGALEAGALHRLVLDSYERELERYGGGEGTRLAESVFHVDSEASLAILGSMGGDAWADARWRLALAGADRLMADFGIDLETRRRLVEAGRAGLVAQLEVGRALEGGLSAKFRSERKGIEELLAGRAPPDLAPGLQILIERSEKLAPLAGELHRLLGEGRVAASLQSLASDFVHLHINRILRSSHQAQELVIYDLLARLYASRLARERGGSQA